MSEVRRRKPRKLQADNLWGHNSSKGAPISHSKDAYLDKFIHCPYSLLFWLCPLTIVLLVCIFVPDNNSDCWPCSDVSCNSTFDVVSARSHLVKVTNIGPRTAGSTANEITTANYLRDELKSIVAVADKTKLQVVFDEHVSNYSSFRAFFHISSYNNVRNFALRFHDLRAKNANISKSAFLINCHYDTAPGSPGASDAFVNCAIMLEVCRLLATSSSILSNDLIFLFNGAEESLLLSSHAFITQHKWASDVIAFMNLEGAGAAKRPMLFQTGPGNSSDVLLDVYASAFKQPFASVLGEDVFQFGLVPSDTDYRIFRDYGLVPGLDLAYTQDGYVYHTPYDTESRISNNCLQQSGNNIFNFIQLIAKDDRIQSFSKLTPINYTSDTLISVSASHSQSDMKSVPPLVTTPAILRQVYFDIFGVTMIVVPWWIWKTFNYLLCGFICFLIMKVRRLVVIRWYGFGLALFLQVVTILMGFTFSVMLGYLYHHYGYRMVWYSNRYNITGMFVLPVIWWFVWSQTCLFRVPNGSAFKFLRVSKFFSSIWQRNSLDYSFLLETDFSDSGVFLIALQLFFISSINAPSSYAYTFWGMFAVIFQLLNTRDTSSKLKCCQAVRFVSFIAVISLHTYNLNLFLDFIIPIMGRAGHVIKPDLFLSCCMFVIILPAVLPFLGQLQSTSRTASKYLCLMLLNACLSYTILIHATNYGFPYSIQSSNSSDSLFSPRYQRLAIFHSNRYLRHIPDSPEITEKESYILIVPIDSNGIRYLTPNSYPISRLRYFMDPKERTQVNYGGIKELVGAQPMGCNYSQPYCGIATVYPLLHVFKYIYRVPAEFHRTEPNVKLKLLSRTLLANYTPNSRLTWNFTFSVVSGPPHTHVLLRTDGNHTRLTAWSFTSTAMYPSSMPLPTSLMSEIPSNKGEHYFLYHLNAAAFGDHGSSWETPWTFWVVLELQGILPLSNYIDVAVAGIYIDENVTSHSPVLLDFISRLPPWVTVIKGCAAYDHWRFELNY
ncbi:Endoplasmic reticulum metallopeptidase 1 [Schistosoma japonicum]|nr:Endoplasmic reticulum metallopeptidase 1 [Schistosoma japonicum]